VIPRLLAEAVRPGEPTPFAGLRRESQPLCFFLDPADVKDGEARRALLAYAAAGTITTFAMGAVDGARTLELPDVPADYAPRHPLEDMLSGKWHEANGSNGLFAVMGLKNRFFSVRAPTTWRAATTPVAPRRCGPDPSAHSHQARIHHGEESADHD
jgi:hypothetical protein